MSRNAQEWEERPNFPETHFVSTEIYTDEALFKEEQSKIFNKFFRGSTVLTDAIPGVGLGLAITKTIIDAHGGSITVSSELGKGATFEVRLPLAEPPLVPAA